MVTQLFWFPVDVVVFVEDFVYFEVELAGFADPFAHTVTVAQSVFDCLKRLLFVLYPDCEGFRPVGGFAHVAVLPSEATHIIVWALIIRLAY